MGPQGPAGPKGEPGEPGGGYMVGMIEFRQWLSSEHVGFNAQSQGTKVETLSVKQLNNKRKLKFTKQIICKQL